MASRAFVFPKGMVRSAGAVVWRRAKGAPKVRPGLPVGPGDLEFLIVHRPRYKDWSWPKGKAETDETIPAAAVREVEEETGVPVALGAPLTTQRYRLGSGHLKEVYYWLGTVIDDGPALAARIPVKRAHKKEIDIVQWVSADKARLMLNRRGDRRLLTEVINKAGRGELITSTTILMRHAKAVDRASWRGQEALRPLTRLGGAQALDVVPLLSAFGVQAVHSSAWKRCEQTATPYAAIAGASYHSHDYLTEDAVADDPDPAAALVARLLEKKRGSRVVSLHRPTYPALVQPVKDLAPRRLISVMDQPRKTLATAEMLVVHVSHASSSRVIAVERYTPLTKVALR